MTPARDRDLGSTLSSAVVLRVEEARCHVIMDGVMTPAEFAPQFPSPRTERVLPGHRVALVRTTAGRNVALWRWYDAVVVGMKKPFVLMWEPAHGEVSATPRDPGFDFTPGSRYYLSAGLPGADWWVAGPADAATSSSVELDEVARLYDDHGLWPSALS